MTKSFKDNYAELLTIPVTTTDEISPNAVTITPTVEPAIIAEVKEVVVDPIKIEIPTTPIHEHVRVELTEEIASVLTEQREQAAAVLESVMKVNTKIANNVSKYVKSSTETNEKLIEAIVKLADKIELLEAKLDVIKDLEIPTPIVQVHSAQGKVHKEIHRDAKGIITHITESEIPQESEDE